jgi:protein-S-isoprenylcysteine O-methyltransferase Ste14
MPASAYLKSGLFVVAAAAALFAAAGTVAIASFWIYLAILAVVIIVSFAALDPDLLRERLRPGGKKSPLSLRIFSLVLFVHWIVAGLDRGRFHWSDDVPGWLQGVCLFTVAAAYALALWAMRVNRFFSSVIRIQTDRGQHVVTTGPYAFVRHPGYTAGILMIAASGPALGSWLAAALVVTFSLPFLLYRAIREDQFLQVELAGYSVTPRGSDGGSSRAFGESQTSFRERVPKVSMLTDVCCWHETAVQSVPANVCSWGKSGHAADITAKTDFDPNGLREHSRDLPIAVTDRAVEAWYHPSIA